MSDPRSMQTAPSLVMPALAAAFAALISVGSYIAIPLPVSPVPIVLQNLFIVLAGLVLGPWWGAASVGLFLLLGAAGLPVFSGGTGGLARFAGPTGGYLVGYLPAVVITGLVAGGNRTGWARNLLAGVAGMAIAYAAGVSWLKHVLRADWTRALAAGILPFLIGDALKLALAAPLAARLNHGIRGLSGRGSDA